MNQVAASLEISPLRAIALSQDLLASYKAIQQLLNTLQVGQVVEVTVQTEVINRVERAILLIESTPVIVSNEQLAKLPTQTGQVVQLQVESINGEQLVLKPIPNNVVSSTPELTQIEQPKPTPVEVAIDTTKLLNLIEQINPDKKAQAAIAELATEISPNQAPPSPNLKAPIQPTNTVQSSHQSRDDHNTQSSSKTNNAPTIELIINSSAQSKQLLDNTNNQSSQRNEPVSNQVVGNSAAQIRNVQTSLTERIIVNKGATANQPENIRSEIKTKPQPSQVSQSTEQVNQKSDQVQTYEKQLDTKSIKIDDSSNIKQTIQATSDPSTRSQSNLDANVVNNSSQPVIEQAVRNQSTNDSALQKFSQPEIKLAIELPNQQTFPLLAEAVAKESSRLSGQKSPLSNSLNSLLAQLNRLNTWQSENKRSLRSEAGQQLSKASRDTSVAIKDLSRYVVNKQQLQTPAQLKKVIKNSGNFLEAKMANQADSKQANRTVHQDVKANVQRLLHATLYHVAKLQAQPSTVNSTANLSSQQSLPYSSSSTNPTSQTRVSPDLVKLVKQKLSTVGSRTIPMDLPSQLIRILKQILNESNRVMTKLQTNQLGNLRADNLTPQWFFEIPVWHQNAVELLQILMRQEEQKKANRKDNVWSLVLQFDLIELGKIRTVLQWQDERIDMRFLAEYPPTVDLINSEMAFIHDIMQRNDLTLENVAVEQAELREIEVDFGTAS